MKLKCKLMTATAVPPRTTLGDAGSDLYSDGDAHLAVGRHAVVPTGVAVEIPEGHVGLVVGRSGLTSRGFGVRLGVIDSGYRGSICVMTHNTSCAQGWTIRPGDRIAQLLVVPVVDVEGWDAVAELSATERGDGGFGSTGT